jgi:hypothetical protein
MLCARLGIGVSDTATTKLRAAAAIVFIFLSFASSRGVSASLPELSAHP